ncbi:carbon-nitrogen hydrolase family protein [Kordiimonas laminariae]|uniref:carbon-nitrogen hydrolase family protein n=1 Tax=Kordiimonas laminariae TaxID=2917717 RepID=UPI001FF4552E|nr:carbon-nitrogen hydrolase family protein [Kordiimonas laminariae]MCK0068286.1 carbon-nitrogen hydrolase family protein [Kordiimonas laminariae]
MSTIIGAVVQAGTPLYDKKATFEKLADLISDAASQGAKLVVLPEAFIGGYPKGLDFGVRLGSRTPEGRVEFQRYVENAIEVPSADTDQIGKIVQKLDVYLVVGVVERDGGTLYCTSLYFSPDGGMIGKHRKLMPTALERVVWGFGDGSTLAAPKTEIGTLGGAICWENYMPQLRLSMYGKGVEFYCAPTVDDRDVWLPTMQTIALEGRCFVLSACQYMERGYGPEDYHPVQGEADDTVLIRGGSCIISPMGEVLAAPVFGKETILTAEMDKSEIIRGKYDLDVVGHYGRPDIFSLHVNEEPQSTCK